MKTSRFEMEEMEIESFQHQALEVRWPDENFDPTMEPEDGESFLTKVIYERMNCPSVVVKPLKESKRKSCNIPNINAIEELIDTSPMNLRPSKEWKETQLKYFSEIREKIITYRNEINRSHKVTTEIDESLIEPMPTTSSTIDACSNNNKNDDNNKQEQQKEQEEQKQEEQQSQQPPITDDEDEWELFCRNNPPLLTIVLPIKQRSLEKLLEFEIDWLQEILINETFILEHWLGSWIYATLATLHMPLEPFTHSALREIAKICIGVKNHLTVKDLDKAVPLNLLIVLISSYFRQLDLCKYV